MSFDKCIQDIIIQIKIMNLNISYPPFSPTLSCPPHPQVTGDLPSISTECLHFPELYERNYTVCTCECVCICVISFTQYTILRFIILQCVSIVSCSKNLCFILDHFWCSSSLIFSPATSNQPLIPSVYFSISHTTVFVFSSIPSF